MIFIAGRGSFSFGYLGQQRHRARTSNGAGELTLMTGAAAGDAPGRDLAPLRHEVLEPAHILVVDELNLVHTELADLAPAEPAPLNGLACWGNLPVLLCG